MDGAAAAAGGKPAPTTAELIAGASQKGPAKGSAAPTAKSKLPLIIGGAVAVVVVVVILAVVLGGGKKDVDADGNPIGEAALKLAKAAEAKKDYKAACEKAEAAGEKAPASYKAKMCTESAGQETFERLEAALAKGDGDAAMNAFEACSANTHFCEKAKAKEEVVKAAFAKKHLAAARAAKGSNPTTCTEEVGKVLSKDPNNAEAQSIQGECSPKQAAAPSPSPRPANDGPSQKDRDAAASKLLASAVAKFGAGDPGAAVNDFKACVAQKPSREILGRCWKNMGVAYNKAGDVPKAVQSLKTYLPFCADDCDQIKAVIARWGG